MTAAPPTNWNWADALEAVAAGAPDRVAQRSGVRTFTWDDFYRRADARAADLLAAGADRILRSLRAEAGDG